MPSKKTKKPKVDLLARMIIMLAFLGVLFGLIFGFKLFSSIMSKRFLSSQVNVVTVSTMKAGQSSWQPELQAVGSLRAIQGVSVTTELAGMVKDIYFNPGATVKKDDVLVQLNADSDNAQLLSLQANAELAGTTFKRDLAQYTVQAVSRQVVDTDDANLKSLLAQVVEQEAIVAKKTLRAPFSGRLGISAVNLGQYLNPGDKVVTLQQLDPIYVDFYVPQQMLDQLTVGQPVTMKIDSFPNETFTGKITTMDPLIDAATRNVEIEATIDNPKLTLLPGMFAAVTVNTGSAQSFITLPQTAVAFNSYGDVVFLVVKDGEKLTVKQTFVTTGEMRGDQVKVLSGLKEGDEVVTSGQMKLKNGALIAVDNTVQPQDSAAPKVVNES